MLDLENAVTVTCLQRHFGLMRVLVAHYLKKSSPADNTRLHGFCPLFTDLRLAHSFYR
jgi:hypothetical protein